MNTEVRLSIGEVALRVGRVAHTVRGWDRDRLPAHLKSHRDERGWRYWTEDQVDGIKEWLVENDVRPGKGLRSHLNES